MTASGEASASRDRERRNWRSTAGHRTRISRLKDELRKVEKHLKLVYESRKDADTVSIVDIRMLARHHCSMPLQARKKKLKTAFQQLR